MKPGQWRVLVLLIALLLLVSIADANVKQFLVNAFSKIVNLPNLSGMGNTAQPIPVPTTTFKSGSGATIVTDQNTGCAKIYTSTGIRTVC